MSYSPPVGEFTPALVRAALDGHSPAIRDLVDLLSPVVQARVARALMRRGPSARDARQEVEDLTQDIFASLFAHDGRLLRTWDPERGLSLRNFVGLIAQREANAILRSGRRNPWKDDPHEPQDLEEVVEPVPDVGPEVASRQELGIVLDRLQAELSPLGVQMFLRLVVQQETVQEVAAAENMSLSAVYAWQSRIGRRVRTLWSELSAEAGASDPQRASAGPVGREGKVGGLR